MADRKQNLTTVYFVEKIRMKKFSLLGHFRCIRIKRLWQPSPHLLVEGQRKQRPTWAHCDSTTRSWRNKIAAQRRSWRWWQRRSCFSQRWHNPSVDGKWEGILGETDHYHAENFQHRRLESPSNPSHLLSEPHSARLCDKSSVLQHIFYSFKSMGNEARR